MKRAFVYTRVSTAEQAREGFSLQEQEDLLVPYAESKGYKVIKVFSDPGNTGTTRNRPGLINMLREIKNVDKVFIYDLTRLSRRQVDALSIIEDDFLANKIELESYSENIDFSTTMGKFTAGMMSSIAQYEVERMAEKTKMGRVARAKQGYYHGGDPSKCPVGYDYVDGLLVKNDYEASCVQFIFNQYVNGYGFASIFESVRDKYPGVINHLSSVRKIVVRKLYKGDVVFDGESYKGKHEPLIDEETFNTAQLLMRKRSSKFDGTKNTYLLSGLVCCGHCDARVAGKSGKKLANGETMKYYVCYSRRKSPKHMMTQVGCDKTFERKEVIEKRVIDQVKKITLSKLKDSRLNRDADKLDNFQKQLNQIDLQISRMVDLFSLDSIPLDVLNSKMQDLETKKDAITKQMNEVKNNEVDYKKIEKIIPKLSKIDSLSEKEQQIILVSLINEITVYNDRTVIDWSF